MEWAINAAFDHLCDGKNYKSSIIDLPTYYVKYIECAVFFKTKWNCYQSSVGPEMDKAKIKQEMNGSASSKKATSNTVREKWCHVPMAFSAVISVTAALITALTVLNQFIKVK